MAREIAFVGMLILLGLGLIACLLPLLQRPRINFHRDACQNNLKQIGLALHNYQDVYKSLPPQYVVGPDGRPWHSWRVLLLPFLEQQPMYELYRFDEPWDGLNNRKLTANRLPIFNCRADPGGVTAESHATSYVVVAGPGYAFDGSRAVMFGEITDPFATTVAVVEIHDSGIEWAEPRDIDHRRFATLPEAHSGGRNTLLMDGSIAFVKPGDLTPRHFEIADGKPSPLPGK